VAEKLNRNWIGVDISHLAVRLIYDRIRKPQVDSPEKFRKLTAEIQIDGFPKDVASARDLARETDKSRLQFQEWVVEIMLGGVSNPKKTADGGYDGYITFYRSEKEKDVALIEAKSGKVNVKNIREFVDVVQHEKAQMGVFVCFEDEITQPMSKYAKEAGYYHKELFGQKFDCVQIVSIEQLLLGESFHHPGFLNTTFKSAIKDIPRKVNGSLKLFENE